MKTRRLVLDTNILISALLSRQGKPARVLFYAVDTVDCQILFSKESFEEIASRAVRPRFEKIQRLEDRKLFVQQLRLLAEWVEITGTLELCRDPDDDKILETAILGGADCLVTGDKDLLALRPAGENKPLQDLSGSLLEGVYILRAAEFLEFLHDD